MKFFCAVTTMKHPDNAELSGKVLDDEIEMESTGGVGGVAQISNEMEIDDVDSEDDNFENSNTILPFEFLENTILVGFFLDYFQNIFRAQYMNQKKMNQFNV